ncbi:tyrosine-type recombinase/integrase [Vibrio vulnificus]|nr:tyrosine-type recombinase/integrase [Vibrio vulnificus]ELR8772779.1 tyrosine-type recombinase/integrase [Vibrio vulnificus]
MFVFGMKLPNGTIMFLLKDRNSTYYARYFFSREKISQGFPKELRFSLSTKQRGVAIDRLMIVIAHIRSHISTCSQSDDSTIVIKHLKFELNRIRKNDFGSANVCVGGMPASPASPAQKRKLADNRVTSQRVLDEFIHSKQSTGILPRSIQQLESRIKSFIKFSQVHVYDATPKLAMKFRDKLLRDGKAEKSVVEYLAAVRQFYKWLCQREDVAKNIFEGVSVQRRQVKASEQRQRWSKQQLIKLFEHRSLKDPEKGVERTQNELEDYWIPQLLLYSGARISEICQLDTSDIKCIDNIWCIDINDNGSNKRLKSVSAKRLVPLHPTLINHGFLRYAQNRYENRQSKLFSFKPIGANMDWSKAYINRFSKILDELGYMASYRPTLHSFRHTFIDELQQRGIAENIVADLAGHAKPTVTYGRYGKRINLRNLQAVVNQIDMFRRK